MAKIRLITIRVPVEEYETLTAYAKQTGRTRTDVLREFIRSLRPNKGD